MGVFILLWLGLTTLRVCLWLWAGKAILLPMEYWRHRLAGTGLIFVAFEVSTAFHLDLKGRWAWLRFPLAIVFLLATSAGVAAGICYLFKL